MQTLLKLGKRPARSDLPPRMQWEASIWTWFDRLGRPPPMGGAPQVAGEAWLNLCDRFGWDQDLAFRLLGKIESAFAAAPVADDDD